MMEQIENYEVNVGGDAVQTSSLRVDIPNL
jgi:hypothetical protein